MRQRLLKYNLPLTERIKFNSKINKSGCWIWNKSTYRHGYAQIKVKGKTCYAHRISYQAFKGEIPIGMFVCHSCDVKKCVNPSHLWLGTHQENENDKKQKNRHAAGERNGQAILRLSQVRMIRKLYLSKKYNSKQLSEKYHVSRSAIRRVVQYVSWIE